MTPDPARDGASSKLVGIQVLRAAAALSVAALHAEHDGKLRAAAAAGVSVSPSIFPWDAGVDVFFVISGFVMVYASGRLFGRKGAFREFLARRIARIVPLYWLTTTLFLLVLALRPELVHSPPTTATAVVSSYLFLPFARPDGIVQPVYTLGWTLNYEMFFYGLFALALALPRRLAVATAGAALGMLVLLGLAWGPLPQPLGFWTDTLLLEFAFGMALGLLRAEGVTLGLAPRLALALAALLWLGWVGGDAATTSALPRALLFGLPAAALVAACGFAPSRARSQESGWERAGTAVGDASYAVYLLHPFVIRAVGRTFDGAGLAVAIGPWGLATLGLGATLLVSLGVFHWLERPLTSRLGRLLARGPAPRSY
ncbi:acyltransferase family protein [uncultured Enterovirga sp.]|uniref:acyltransferase family protein n=1 Tax=uncultured Enterovirga sp. TaxID=2026352 RepID=UPI0035CB5AE7